MSAPIAGRVIARIAPFLGVRRIAVAAAGRQARPVDAERSDWTATMRPAPLRPGAARPARSIPMIAGVTADSRKVRAGLPVRRPARAPRPDGRAFVPAALDAGAAAPCWPARTFPGLAAPVIEVRRSAPRLRPGGGGLLRRPAADLRRGHRHQRQDLGRGLLPPNLRSGWAILRPAWARSACAPARTQLTPPGLTTPDAADVGAHAGRPGRRAASPTWRWRPLRTGSTSVAWTG